MAIKQVGHKQGRRAHLKLISSSGGSDRYPIRRSITSLLLKLHRKISAVSSPETLRAAYETKDTRGHRNTLPMLLVSHHSGILLVNIPVAYL
jgi:hypothetical protein